MRRLFSTRFGFFALAAAVSALLTPAVDHQFRWLTIGLAALYAVLSVLFLLDDLGKVTGARRPSAPVSPPSPYEPPPFIGRST